MLTIACVKWGTAYGPEYVNILADMVRRNLAEGTVGRFVCFTDDPAGLDVGIETRPVPEGLTGWWNKLALFAPEAFPAGDRVVYFDLDTVIIGALDQIVTYDGPFAILKDFYRPHGLQSSVMAWEAGTHSGVWHQWLSAGKPEVLGGDQVWLERTLTHYDLWQTRYPDQFVSYKVHCTPYPPKGTRVVVFHGQPRPHNCGSDWVRLAWKIGGGSSPELTFQTNTDAETVLANVRASSALDLKWLTMQEAHDREICLVGGGPSLAETIETIRTKAQAGAVIVALNNTAAHLLSHDIVPDWHVLLDARPHNVRFIQDAGQYFVASQCPPVLFERLRDRTVVTLFHPHLPGIEQHIPETGKELLLLGGGSTVGLLALSLAYSQGFRKMHCFGFDSSYRDDRHHAYAQAENDREQCVEVAIGGRTYRAAAWMVTQVQQFLETARELAEQGCEITTHGDGLLPYAAWLMMQMPQQLPAHEVRAAEVLKRIAEVQRPIGAEIGVFAGAMSQALLRRDDLTLYMVDSWQALGKDYLGESGDWHATLTQAQQDNYYAAACTVTEVAGPRRVILKSRSCEAAQHVADDSLDFVFVDADHSYEGCKADLHLWYAKVKPGGLFGGHDYNNTDYPGFGVTQAVDEFVKEQGLSLELGENFTWFAQRPREAV